MHIIIWATYMDRSMRIKTIFGILLLAAVPLWCQVEPAATGSATTQDNNIRMQIPPPVSTDPYPSTTGSGMRSNYLRFSITFNPAYTDNIPYYTVNGTRADMLYTLRSTFEFDQAGSRGHQRIAYHPGFTLYQRTNARNEVDHNFLYDLEYLLSPHVQVAIRDSFQKSSNIFSQPYFGLGEPISGSVPLPSEGAIPVFADRMNEVGSAQLSYQFSASSMIGANGTLTKLTYPDLTRATGLCDSSSLGGSGFYNHRLSASQYVGAEYQYLDTLACPVPNQISTLTHTIFLYYTKYLTHSISLSVSAGPQHYDTTFSVFPAAGSWTPFVSASTGWQWARTNFAASYSRTFEGGGGLIGTFQSSRANASLQTQLARNWSLRAAADYHIHKNVNSFLTSHSQNGHTVGGSVALTRRFGAHFTAEFGYDRQHQSYENIPAIAIAPNIDRTFISVSYEFFKPLGR